MSHLSTQFENLIQYYKSVTLPGDARILDDVSKELKRLQKEEDIASHAKNLALSLECILLDCKDSAVSAKWWDSATKALKQYQDACRTVYR